MDTQELRNIFADELVLEGQLGLANMVRTGYDNSSGGTAAIRAMEKVVKIKDARIQDLLESNNEKLENYRISKAKIAELEAGQLRMTSMLQLESMMMIQILGNLLGYPRNDAGYAETHGRYPLALLKELKQKLDGSGVKLSEAA